MRKSLLAAAVTGVILLSAGVQAQEQAAPEGYQLQQVLIMSRHNLRAPLANNGSVLEQSTPKSWPEWDVPGGQLTTKGGVLEVYMGHYMREWLAQQGLVTSGECRRRTRSTPMPIACSAPSPPRSSLSPARFRLRRDRAPSGKMGTMDPTFNPVITDDSAAFSEKAVQAMEKERQGMQLSESYKLLEEMTDYRNSPSCKESSSAR